MSTNTLQDTSTLVIHECWCGIRHAIPANLSKQARDYGHKVYCPAGHGWVIQKTNLQKVKDEAAWLSSRLDQEIAERKQTAASLRAQKAATTKLRKRIEAGVCPHCTRTFQNLQRHIESKHAAECVNASSSKGKQSA